jgi:uncharacterized protein (TIGR02117 family)
MMRSRGTALSEWGRRAHQVNAHHINVIAGACAAGAALLVLAACTGISTHSTPPAPPTPASQERQTVYVVRRGWHIDIGIARGDAQPPLLQVAAAFPQARYLLFGFGDRRYLLHGGAGNMVAALWGGAGLVLVTSLGPQQPEQVFGRESVVVVALTPKQMSDLQAFIGRSFAAHDGALVPVPPGPHSVGSFNTFYESAQRYSALHTCNTWAAEVLQSAQLPINSSGVEFASQLWQQVRRLGSPHDGTYAYARGTRHALLSVT